MKIFYCLIACLGLSFSTTKSVAQCLPVMLDDSSQFVVDGNINATTTRNNILYLGGDFNYIGRYTGSFIGIDTLTGQPVNRRAWPKVNGAVYKAISDGSGGWYIGGTFTAVGDSSRNNIAQINSSGVVTPWNPNANGVVFSLLHLNNKVYAGGGFTNIAGVTRNRLAAISAATGTASGWNPNCNDTVYDLQSYTSHIYAGGNFTHVGGLSRNFIAQLDSVSGSATSWNASCSGVYVKSIGFKGANVYVGGGYWNIGGQWRTDLAALDTLSGLATTWYPIPENAVNKIVMNTNTMYIGGIFNAVGSVARPGFAEVSLYADTATAFNPIPFFSGPGTVYDICVNGNKIYLSGGSNSIYQINISADTLTSWRSYSGRNVYTLGMSNGILYAGGDFITTGAAKRTRLAAIDMNADTLTKWAPSADHSVLALAACPNAIFAGGLFSNRFEAWDTTTGAIVPAFSLMYGFGSYSNLLYRSGTLYIGGYFGSIIDASGATFSRNSLAAMDAVTGLMTSWNPNCIYSSDPGDVQHMVTDGNSMYLIGDFTQIGSSTRNEIGAVSLSTGLPTSWYPTTDNRVEALAISGGSIFLGGNFSDINGYFSPRLAKMNLATGATSTSWSPYPSGDVLFLKPQQNFLYTAGSFSSVHGSTLNGFGILDTATNFPLSWDPAPSPNTINAIEFYANKMYVAGTISSISGRYDFSNLAIYKINTISNTVTISGPDTVCTALALTFTATPSFTGGSLQWRVNGINRGTGAGAYTYTPVNGDVVSCVGYAPSGCYTPDSAVSNLKTIVVNPNVSISGPASVCAGIPVTDTAVSGSSGVTYQWRVNGIGAGTGSTHTYTPTTGDHITCTIHGVTGCPGHDSAVSSIITMTVTPNTDILTSASFAHDTLCSGDTAFFVAHSGAIGLSYQWKLNRVDTGLNDSLYSYVPSDSDTLKCIVAASAAGCYVANPDSMVIALTVNPETHPAITITGDSVICAGDPGNYHLATIISGATNRWYRNNLSTGITSLTYTYAPAPGDSVKCIVTLPSSACYFPLADTSNSILITVNPKTIPVITISAGSDTVCQGGAAEFLAAPHGITGGIYRWQVNGTAVGTGVNTYGYVPAGGDNIKCILRTPPGCFTDTTAASNTISMTVVPLAVPVITLTATPGANIGDLITVTATVSNAGPNYLITWYNNGVVFNSSTIPTTSYFKGPRTDTITAKITSESPGCYDTTISPPAMIIENPNGIHDANPASGVVAYPNPFDEQLTIKGLNTDDRIELYDVSGKKIQVKTTAIHSGQSELINDYPCGFYLLKILNAEGNTRANIPVTKR